MTRTTELAFVPVINNCAKFTSGKAFFIKGQPYWGSSLTLIDNQASGAFKAIDVTTGQIKWEVATRSPMVAGVLATGGGLVFTGDAEGFFTAYDSQTGKDLWNFQCGSGHHSGPITYMLDGRQYIAVCVGWGGWTAGFAGDGAPWLRNARRGNTLFVFALPEDGQAGKMSGTLAWQAQDEYCMFRQTPLRKGSMKSAIRFRWSVGCAALSCWGFRMAKGRAASATGITTMRPCAQQGL